MKECFNTKYFLIICKKVYTVPILSCDFESDYYQNKQMKWKKKVTTYNVNNWIDGLFCNKNSVCNKSH